MKKIYKYIHAFSSLSISFILLLCIIFLIFIIYSNYRSYDLTNKDNSVFEDEIRIITTENSNYIKQMLSEIKNTKLYLSEIENSINSISDTKTNENFNKLINSFEDLSKKVINLSSELASIKSESLSKNENIPSSENRTINKSIKQITDLILLKYENGLTIDNEVDYLKNILNPPNNTYLEKIQVLQTNPFKGYDYLMKNFQDEVNIFFKQNINQNKNSLINKIILPYVKIAPSSENIINDDLVIIIKKIELDISNNKIEEALKNFNQINKYKDFFNITIFEMNKYINFKNELSKIK